MPGQKVLHVVSEGSQKFKVWLWLWGEKSSVPRNTAVSRLLLPRYTAITCHWFIHYFDEWHRQSSLFRVQAGHSPSPSSVWHCSKTNSGPWWPASWLSGWQYGLVAAPAPDLLLASAEKGKRVREQWTKKLHTLKKKKKPNICNFSSTALCHVTQCSETVIKNLQD